mmetsp:Transcript_19223/g.24220  ORF Transcript_19223/g.24220 Transcript_19223/m.24220 type:complete len:154 (-) Transcript_19223:347-808(-)
MAPLSTARKDRLAFDIPFTTSSSAYAYHPYVETNTMYYKTNTSDEMKTGEREERGEKAKSRTKNINIGKLKTNNEGKPTTGNEDEIKMEIQIEPRNDFNQERQKILQSASQRLPMILNVMSRANKKLGQSVGAEINEMRSLWYHGINHGERYV